MKRLSIWSAAILAVLLITGAAGSPALAETDAAPAAGQPEASQRVEPQASLPDLEDEVMCPICGTLLGLSRAPAAERQRVFIRKLIREGKTDQEIKDALVAEYGPQVLALPDDDRVNFWVYVVPLAGLILAAAGVLWAGFRWRRQRLPAGESGATGRGKSSADSERLDRELDDYDR